ncbi:hypothetical protein Tco_1275783 [Tanacetum coccineum]
MWRPVVMAKLVHRLSSPGTIQAQSVLCNHNVIVQDQTPISRNVARGFHAGVNEYSGEPMSKRQIGDNVSRTDKVNFLVKILMDLDNSKESVYGALDAWVAWEQDFPIGPLRQALIALEKEHQWHQIIHVIKWMLSKGQGTTLGTYGQLVRALDMDHMVEEAHEVCVKKLAGLEAFDRKPRDKKIVKKVGDAYEVFGMVGEKERLLEKYKSLFDETSSTKKSKRGKQCCRWGDKGKEMMAMTDQSQLVSWLSFD